MRKAGLASSRLEKQNLYFSQCLWYNVSDEFTRMGNPPSLFDKLRATARQGESRIIAFEMFDLLPQLIIVASIAGIIAIIVRKLPTLSSIPDDMKIADINGKSEKFKVPGFLHKLWLKIKSFKYSEHFHKLLDITEKFLRKLKVMFLKIENKTSDWAEALRKHSQNFKIRREGIEIEVKSADESANSSFVSLKKSESRSSANKEDKDTSPADKELNALEEKYISEITKNPRNTEAYRRLGDLYIKKNNISDARETFRQILRLNPSDKDAGLKLMKLRVRKKV